MSQDGGNEDGDRAEDAGGAREIAPRTPRVPRRGPDRAEAAPEAPRAPAPTGLANPLLRLLAVNLLIGAGVGEAAFGLLFWTDTLGIASLIRNAAQPWLPFALLGFVFALTFAAAVTATAVLTMPYASKDDPRDD